MPARVLVVEDEPDIAELVRIRLEVDGHDLTVMHDGVSGRDALTQQEFDVIVLDWTLPELNGIELCTWIRSNPHLAEIPVILMTARAQKADIEEGYAAGASVFLSKPFSPRELAALVQSLADGSASQSGSAHD